MADHDQEYERKLAAARERVGKLRSFYQSLGGLIVATLFFATINFLTSPGFPWFIFPVLGIGMGVAYQAWDLFGPGNLGGDWEERKIRELMGEEAKAKRKNTSADDYFEEEA